MRGRRAPWILALVAVAAVAAVVLLTRGAGTNTPAPTVVPAHAACAPHSQDLNVSDSSVLPSRGKRLIPKINGHIPIGFNDSAYLTGQLTIAQTLSLDQQIGASIWRLPLDWGRVEAKRGTLDFHFYDAIYCAARKANVRILWQVAGIPLWASDGACSAGPCVRPPADEYLPDLQRFSEALAIRYPHLAAIEAWNEPNLGAFWGGRPDADQYLPVLRAIYTGVKNGSPDMPVLGGVLSNNPTDSATNVSLATYLKAILDRGALHYMDGLSLHTYPLAPLGQPGDQFTPSIALARKELASAGAPGARIWITEAGAPTASGAFAPMVSPAEQADLLRGMYEALDHSTYADAFIVHTLVDPTPAVPGGPGFGVLEAPSEPGASVATKPAACTLIELSGSGSGCPASLQP